MPLIFGIVMTSVRQESAHVLLLIYAFDIAVRKKSISQAESDFFFRHFVQIPGFRRWTVFDKDFYDSDHGILSARKSGVDIVPQARGEAYKKELLILYPEFEETKVRLNAAITERTTYATLRTELKALSEEIGLPAAKLIRQINVALILPGAELKSLLNKFVHDELKDILDVSFDFLKFHKFIKTASWPLPIAIHAAGSLNLVNTICSIASFYGVGLEVLRTDDDNSIIRTRIEKSIGLSKKFWPYEKEPKFAAAYERELLEADDRRQLLTVQSSLDLIRDCALQGNWVLISTVKMISYWHKVCALLEDLYKAGRTAHSFRLFIDWQFMHRKDIPETLLFDHAFSFYLTELNADDMEGYNDVWAHILDSTIIKGEILYVHLSL